MCFSAYKPKVGTVGPACPGVEVKIAEDGEVCCRGGNVFVGYLDDPEKTAEALDPDGTLHSGDIGTFDDEGYLTIVDRKKDMLIYKGYNVYPRELEEVLFQHPAVANAAVVGKRDVAVGELPVAFVVLADPVASPDEIRDYVNGRVTPYKKLRDIRVIDEIPVSAAGKVLRRELRAVVEGES
jgi:long-chain acyl-CoA synthetase